MFQLALPRRERRNFRIENVNGEESFNSRSREGSDNDKGDDVDPRQSFNSRSREGSDRPKLKRDAVEQVFQLALPRRERQSPLIVFKTLAKVSTRAPAKGATAAACAPYNSVPKVSTRAPAKGATDLQCYNQPW